MRNDSKGRLPRSLLAPAALVLCGLVASSGCSSGTLGGSAPAPKAPSANAGGPYMALPGASVTFSGAASSDPQNSALTYVWSFGDNTTGTGAAPSHSYAAVGSYPVSVTATDTLGLSATATTTATITAQAPAANAGGPYTTSVGSPVAFDGSKSSDPQGQTLTYAWDFGDGTTGSGAQQSHFYSTHGFYTATLTVTDSTYNLTGNTTASVTNAQAAVQPMTNVVQGAKGISSGYFSDPYPVQTVVPNGSPVPSFVGTTQGILTCPAALQAGCFTANPNTITLNSTLQDMLLPRTEATHSFENLNSYQDSQGNWQMAATVKITPTDTAKNPWTAIVHAYPVAPYTGIPTTWVADALLVGTFKAYAHDNYDGRYFEDSGVLYLLYNRKNPGLNLLTDEDYIVAQTMVSASVPTGDAPVPLLGPEDSDGGYESELSTIPGQTDPVKLIESGHVLKIQGKYVIAYSTGYFSQPSYKAGIAWSDTFLPTPGTYYKRAQKVDVAGVWGVPDHVEVAYLLQSEHAQWPNYVASQVLAPGVPSVVADTSGNFHLFFAGYSPADVATVPPETPYPGPLRRPWYVDLKVNIPSGTKVADASPFDLASWIQLATTP